LTKSLTTVRWLKKACGAFSPHMLLRGPVEAKDADRPPWLPRDFRLTEYDYRLMSSKLVSFSNRSIYNGNRVEVIFLIEILRK